MGLLHKTAQCLVVYVTVVDTVKILQKILLKCLHCQWCMIYKIVYVGLAQPLAIIFRSLLDYSYPVIERNLKLSKRETENPLSISIKSVHKRRVHKDKNHINILLSDFENSHADDALSVAIKKITAFILARFDYPKSRMISMRRFNNLKGFLKLAGLILLVNDPAERSCCLDKVHI